jgi:hypothetical protein
MSRTTAVAFFIVALAVAVLGALAFGAFEREEARATAPCTDSFARWGHLTGRWEGTWDNHTFLSGGDLSLDAEVREDCTASMAITGVFMQPGVQTINAVYHDDGTDTVLEVTGNPIFGNTTITIADDGEINIQGTGLHQLITSVEATGMVTADTLDLELTMQVVGFPDVTETIHLDKVFALIQGDINCDGVVDLEDFRLLIEYAADLAGGQQSAPCPDVGEPVEVTGFPWADVNCDGVVDGTDALFIIAGLVDILLPPSDGDCTPLDDLLPADLGN